MTFTGQTPLGKGNFPFNLDNTVSIVQFPFRNKHGLPGKCSSKFPDTVLDIIIIKFGYNARYHWLKERAL